MAKIAIAVISGALYVMGMELFIRTVPYSALGENSSYATILYMVFFYGGAPLLLGLVVALLTRSENAWILGLLSLTVYIAYLLFQDLFFTVHVYKNRSIQDVLYGTVVLTGVPTTLSVILGGAVGQYIYKRRAKTQDVK